MYFSTAHATQNHGIHELCAIIIGMSATFLIISYDFRAATLRWQKFAGKVLDSVHFTGIKFFYWHIALGMHARRVPRLIWTRIFSFVLHECIRSYTKRVLWELLSPPWITSLPAFSESLHVRSCIIMHVMCPHVYTLNKCTHTCVSRLSLGLFQIITSIKFCIVVQICRNIPTLVPAKIGYV